MSVSAQNSTVKAQTLIAVRNVRASSRWYTELLGADSLPEHSHRDLYDRISRSGKVLLQLHAWDEEDHPNLVNADAAPPGHGILLWFQVDDFDSVVERARGLRAEIIEEPHINYNARHREIWLRDSDGYVVVVASPDGECATPAPEGWHSVIPRLVARDPARLVQFLQTAFEASGAYTTEAPSLIRIGDSIVMVSGAGPREPTATFLHLYVDDADETYRRAVQAGALSLEEPSDMPYGDRRAMVKDPCGNDWQIATYKGIPS